MLDPFVIQARVRFARGGARHFGASQRDANASIRDDKEGWLRYSRHMTNPVLVEVTRGPLVESIHRGAVAVADARGGLRLSLGNVERPIFPRSALKPIQAVPLIETGAADAFAVSDQELALACASHSGEPQHTERSASWQRRIGCSDA